MQDASCLDVAADAVISVVDTIKDVRWEFSDDKTIPPHHGIGLA